MLIKWTQCFIYKVCMWIALGLSMSSHSIDKSSIEESVYSREKAQSYQISLLSNQSYFRKIEKCVSLSLKIDF